MMLVMVIIGRPRVWLGEIEDSTTVDPPVDIDNIVKDLSHFPMGSSN